MLSVCLQFLFSQDPLHYVHLILPLAQYLRFHTNDFYVFQLFSGNIGCFDHMYTLSVLCREKTLFHTLNILYYGLPKQTLYNYVTWYNQSPIFILESAILNFSSSIHPVWSRSQGENHCSLCLLCSWLMWRHGKATIASSRRPKRTNSSQHSYELVFLIHRVLCTFKFSPGAFYIYCIDAPK